MAWKELRLPIAEYLAETRTPLLDRQQQGQLAQGWAAVWLEAEWDEDAWRRALGFSAAAWELQREDFAAVLDRGNGVWALPFMLRERRRQEAESAAQGERARKRWEAAASAGMPPHATASPASASASTPGTSRARRARNGSSGEPDYSPEFLRFWGEYRCPRRRGKPQAWAVWKAVAGDRIAADVMAALAAYKATREWLDGYMPEPARWLKKRPWDGPVPQEDPSW